MDETSIKIDGMSGNMDTSNINLSNKKFNFSTITNLTSASLPSLGDFLKESRQNIRPWSEFLQTSNFKTVANVQRLTQRIIRNLNYFQSNYFFVFIGLILYCLITSPLILIVLAGVFYLCYKIKQNKAPITLFQRQLNTNQQCLVVNCASMPLLYLAGAGSIMFWVLGASFFVISIHAAFYNIDAIVTEDTEGFLAETV